MRWGVTWCNPSLGLTTVLKEFEEALSEPNGDGQESQMVPPEEMRPT